MFMCWERGGTENDSKIFLATVGDSISQDLECKGYCRFGSGDYKQILHSEFGEFHSVNVVEMCL